MVKLGVDWGRSEGIFSQTGAFWESVFFCKLAQVAGPALAAPAPALALAFAWVVQEQFPLKKWVARFGPKLKLCIDIF